MRVEGGQQLLLLALMPKMLYLSLCPDSRVEGKCISALVTPSYHFVPNMLGIQCLQVNGSWLSVGISAGLITTRPEAKCSSHREAQGAQALHRQQRTLPHALHFVTSLEWGRISTETKQNQAYRHRRESSPLALTREPLIFPSSPLSTTLQQTSQ